MMGDTIIFVIAMLLFGKMIYWMHENRNNLGEIAKRSLHKILEGIVFLVGVVLGFVGAMLGVAIIIGIIAGGLWLVAKIFNTSIVKMVFLAFIAFIIYCIVSSPSRPPKRERTASEVYYRVLSRQKYERLKLELNDLENKRDRTDWSDKTYLYFELIEQIEDLRREIADLEDYLRE